MKLEPDVVREMLLSIEQQQTSGQWQATYCSGDDFQKFYTAQRLIEGGILNGREIPSDDDEGCVTILSMTMRGHEFLDSVRDNAAWSAAKTVAAKVGSFSLDVLSAVARAFIMAKVNQLTGLS